MIGERVCHVLKTARRSQGPNETSKGESDRRPGRRGSRSHSVWVETEWSPVRHGWSPSLIPNLRCFDKREKGVPLWTQFLLYLWPPWLWLGTSYMSACFLLYSFLILSQFCWLLLPVSLSVLPPTSLACRSLLLIFLILFYGTCLFDWLLASYMLLLPEPEVSLGRACCLLISYSALRRELSWWLHSIAGETIGGTEKYLINIGTVKKYRWFVSLAHMHME